MLTGFAKSSLQRASQRDRLLQQRDLHSQRPGLKKEPKPGDLAYATCDQLSGCLRGAVLRILTLFSYASRARPALKEKHIFACVQGECTMSALSLGQLMHRRMMLDHSGFDVSCHVPAALVLPLEVLAPL